MISPTGTPGRLPSRVYRRRRTFVAAGLIAVFIFLFSITRPSESQHAQQPTPTPTAPSEQTPSPSPQPVAPPKCEQGVIVVLPMTDATNYGPGEMPKLSLSVTNTSAASCMIDAGSDQQVFTIKSGAEMYWDSTHCQTQPVAASLTLEPGQTVNSQSPITWDRTISNPETCGSERQAAPAGGVSYHLSVSVGGFAATESKQFILE